MQEESSQFNMPFKNIQNIEKLQESQNKNSNNSSLSSSLVLLDLKKNLSIETNSSQNIISEKHDNQDIQNCSQRDLAFSSIQVFERKVKCKLREKNNKFPSAFQLINQNILKSSYLDKVTLTQLSSFNFSVLSYSLKQLIDYSSLILQSNLFCNRVFPNNAVRKLVQRIALSYNGVSYHNFSHAFSLMLLNFQCLQKEKQFKKYFSQQEKFCIIIAGLSHDLNHRGTNNMYQIKSQSELAKKYNNQSVLQNMHISSLWSILNQNQSFNFLKQCQNPNQCKKFITNLILSTDMFHHFKNLQHLQKRRQNKINFKNFEDRNFMMEQLFHACDIGNSTLNYQFYITWSSLLSYQFDSQFKLQKQNCLEPTAMFEYKNISSFYKDQLWFVGKIAFPLWKQINYHFNSIQILLQNMNRNIDKLNEKLTQQQLIQRS